MTLEFGVLAAAAGLNILLLLVLHAMLTRCRRSLSSMGERLEAAHGMAECRLLNELRAAGALLRIEIREATGDPRASIRRAELH